MSKRVENKKVQVDDLKVLKAEEKELLKEVKDIKNEKKEEQKEINNILVETEQKKVDNDSLLKAINETDAEIEEIRTEEKSYNLFISHNKVLVVPKITKADIKDGGKLSEGYDYDNNIKVKILDKDYGKSAELMRALLEKDAKRPLWLLLLMIVGGLGATIGFIMVLVAVFEDTNVKDIKKATGELIPISSEIKEETLPINNNINEQNVNNIRALGLPGENNINIEQTGNKEIDNLKKDFELETLKLEVKRILEEKNILTHKNFELEGIIAEKEINIKELKEKLEIYTDKGENLSLENFKSYLGKMVYEGCEKREKQGLENNCKDLYFKFVKNVNGLNK